MARLRYVINLGPCLRGRGERMAGTSASPRKAAGRRDLFNSRRFRPQCRRRADRGHGTRRPGWRHPRLSAKAGRRERAWCRTAHFGERPRFGGLDRSSDQGVRRKGPVIVTTKGISPQQMREEGRIGPDPHAWQSIANAKILCCQYPRRSDRCRSRRRFGLSCQCE